MHGHENILALRSEGKVPKIVFLNDYPCKTDWFEHGENATICTAGEPISSLDLRFLVGMTVSISATSEKRAKALFNKVIAAKAKTVAACHTQLDVQPWQQTGWAEVHHG